MIFVCTLANDSYTSSGLANLKELMQSVYIINMDTCNVTLKKEANCKRFVLAEA